MNLTRKMKFLGLSAGIIFILSSGIFSVFPASAAKVGNLVTFKSATTVGVPGGLTGKEIVQGMKIGLLEQGWSFSEAGGQALVGVLRIRTHELKVKLTQSGQQVRIEYVDSKNLNYGPYKDDSEYPLLKPGTIVIHEAYDEWMQKLADNIGLEYRRILVRK